MDGRNTTELKPDYYLSITTSEFPLPSICRSDQVNDWFEGLAQCLHWNQRQKQLPLNACYLQAQNSSSQSQSQSLNHSSSQSQIHSSFSSKSSSSSSLKQNSEMTSSTTSTATTQNNSLNENNNKKDELNHQALADSHLKVDDS